MPTFVASSTTFHHEWMVKFIEHRVADRRVVRLIQKWLRTGVSSLSELFGVGPPTLFGATSWVTVRWYAR